LAGRRNQARSSLSGQRLIANLNVADHALTVGIDIDASLNIAIRCVDRGSDVDPAAAKSKMVVVVMMMMMMVVMVVMVVIKEPVAAEVLAVVPAPDRRRAEPLWRSQSVPADPRRISVNRSLP
jgi:hypothetical protein